MATLSKKRSARSSKSQQAARPVRKGRALHTVDVMAISGRLLFGVSERYLHSEVRMHREREKKSDGMQILKAIEATHDKA